MDAGAGARPSSTMRGVVDGPYTRASASWSICSTAPSSDTPANSPRARDHDQISAFSWPSVAAAALRPTGPAATPASAPRVNLPLTTSSRLRSLRNTSTTSADCTPAWKPTLPPVRVTNTGLDQAPSVPFTDIRPWPRRPPSTRPALIVSGTTRIARASSSSLSGIACSGIFWISDSTRTALRARSSSGGAAAAWSATANRKASGSRYLGSDSMEGSWNGMRGQAAVRLETKQAAMNRA